MNEKKIKIAVLRAGRLGDSLVSFYALRTICNLLPNSTIEFIALGAPKNQIEIIRESLRFFVEPVIYRPVTKGASNLLYIFKIAFILIFKNKYDYIFSLEATYWGGKRGILKFLFKERYISFYKKQSKKISKEYEQASPIFEVLNNQSCQLVMKLLQTDTLYEIKKKSEKYRYAKIESYKVKPEKNKILLGLNSNMKSKMLSMHQCIELVRVLINIFDVEIYFVGDESEREYYSKIIENDAEFKKIKNLCGSITVRETLLLLSKIECYVGLDSGLMHLCAEFEMPIVAIFSNIDVPGRWRPNANKYFEWRDKVECEGCFETKCPKKIHECLNNFDPIFVVNALRELKVPENKL